MITITEEPYDDAVACALVQVLMAELNERYAGIDEADDPGDEDFAKELGPA